MTRKTAAHEVAMTNTQLRLELEQLKQRLAELEAKEALREHLFEELQKNESRLKETERIANIGSWEMDIATGKSTWSDGFFHICGLEPGSVEPSAELGMQIIHPDDRERASQGVQKAIQQGGEYHIEKRIVRPNGEIRTVLSRGEIITDKNNNPIKLVGAFMDITNLKKTENALIETEERYKHLFENSLAGIGLATMEGKIIDSNASFCRMLGYTKDQLMELKLKDLYQDPAHRDEIVKELQEKGCVKEKEVKLKKKNGEIIDLFVTVNVLNIGGDMLLLTNGIDVTGLKQAEAEIRQLNEELEARVNERTVALEAANKELQRISITDALTGVHNRRFFNETMVKEWRRALREKANLSLLMVDIDFFKAYNDHYGHLEGDKCLAGVVAALKRSLKRPADFLARYGGEEFVALLPNTEIPGALSVAKTMQQNIKEINLPHSTSDVAGHVTVSIGVSSILPEKNTNYTELIQAADNALYQAKNQGRNRIITASSIMQNPIS